MRHRSRRRSAPTPSAHRGHLVWAGLAYLAFVIYGSLVPLDFKALPLEEAVARFRAVPFLDLGIGSRADWVANLLLFIPLTFLWTGALAHGRSLAAGLLATACVLVAAVALCLGIEFTQLFFPQRTVSQNDIFAEALGGVLGSGAWWWLGGRWMAWYRSWHQDKPPMETAQRLVWAYLAVVFAYGVLPLDLTLSAVEIFHKWREGKLNLVPFGDLPGDGAQAAYELVSDALLWVLPAFLWRWQAAIGATSAWLRTFAAVALLEVLQLFVYSRVSDVTDLFTGALGAGLGVWLGGLPNARPGQVAAPDLGRAGGSGRSAAPWWLLAAGLVWTGVLMGVFWYPFNFHTEGSLIRERLDLFAKVPFETYYYGTEFRAVTEVFHKLLFFAPLGGLLAGFVGTLPWRWRDLGFGLALVLMLALPLGIELGQVLLPEKYPDSTDWILASLGCILGYVLWRGLGPRLLGPARRRGASSQPIPRYQSGRTRS